MDILNRKKVIQYQGNIKFKKKKCQTCAITFKMKKIESVRYKIFRNFLVISFQIKKKIHLNLMKLSHTDYFTSHVIFFHKNRTSGINDFFFSFERIHTYSHDLHAILSLFNANHNNINLEFCRHTVSS